MSDLLAEAHAWTPDGVHQHAASAHDTIRRLADALEHERAAITDALTIERTAQEQSRQLSATHRELRVQGIGGGIPAVRRAEMDALVADAAERMADRLREVMPDDLGR